MLDIYDADGHLDRARVLDTMDEILRRTKHGLTKFQRDDLVALLDECCEGFTFDPIESPGMYSDLVNACRPVWSSTPPKTHGR